MKPTDFATHLSAFLVNYLPTQRNASANTVKAYRDVFALLLRYCRDVRGILPERLRLDNFDPDLVLAFLQHLETDRRCQISTINQRLAALHAFFRYLQTEAPERLAQCQRILAIPFRRYPKPQVDYLSSEDLSALLKQPCLDNQHGRRDAMILSLLYDTGARVQELIDLSVEDLRLESPAQVRLTGKGRKKRTIPLMESTVAILQEYLQEHHLNRPERSNDPLFQNRWGRRFSRSGIRHLLTKYADRARAVHTSLPKKLHPHTLRHTKAMHLLQTGNPLTVIRDILGHTDIRTTEVYAKADLEMRREALQKATAKSPQPIKSSWHENKELLTWLRSL